MLFGRIISRVRTTHFLLFTIVAFQLLIIFSLFIMQFPPSSNLTVDDNINNKDIIDNNNNNFNNYNNENENNHNNIIDEQQEQQEQQIRQTEDEQLPIEDQANDHFIDDTPKNEDNKLHDRLMQMNSFEDMVREISARYQTVIVSVSDYGYREFAYNFVQKSLKPHGLDDQYIIVSADSQIYEYLRERGILTVLPQDRADTKGNANGAEFGTRFFTKVVNMKGGLTVDVLKYGASIFLSDVDIAFFENPLPLLRQELESNRADVVVQTDSADPGNIEFAVNSGFYLADPTPKALELFEMQHKYELKGTRNQPALIRARKMLGKNVKMHILDWKRFPNGAHYFDQRRFEKESNLHPVIIHNNWIVGMHGKRYRFREIGAWENEDELYYNDPQAKYITTSLPPFNQDLDKSAFPSEKQAIKNLFALAHITGRIPILPLFHCFKNRPSTRCFYHENFLVKGLDLSPFQYREHYFLQDERVPQHQVDNRGMIFAIHENIDTTTYSIDSKQLMYGFNDKTKTRASRAEIESWLTNNHADVPLIEFVGLEKDQVKIAPEDSELWQKLDKFIVSSDAKQEKARKFKI